EGWALALEARTHGELRAGAACVLGGRPPARAQRREHVADGFEMMARHVLVFIVRGLAVRGGRDRHSLRLLSGAALDGQLQILPERIVDVRLARARSEHAAKARRTRIRAEHAAWIGIVGEHAGIAGAARERPCEQRRRKGEADDQPTKTCTHAKPDGARVAFYLVRGEEKTSRAPSGSLPRRLAGDRFHLKIARKPV